MIGRALIVIVLFATFVSAREGEDDVVVLESGESIVCDIEALTDNIVTFSLPPAPGATAGSAKRTLQMETVSHVVFGFEKGEEDTFAQRDKLDSALLETWWNFHFAHLHRPRSRTAAWGNALASALLREEPESNAKRALALSDRIIARAWSEDDVAAAKQGRLEALIALGDLETAMGEARLLAQQTEDPELLIEVKHLLAQADFAALRELEEENPRWVEDDEVRPERNELYHRVIDQYLWPHLFHATRTDAAARGLLSAAEVYRFGQDVERARQACRDLVRLYPDAEQVAPAQQIIDTLSKANSSSPNDNP